MAPQSARRDRKNQGFPPCYPSTLMGDLDPVRELPYGLAAHELHQEAGQMAASDQVSDQPKNRLRSGGRPQMGKRARERQKPKGRTGRSSHYANGMNGSNPDGKFGWKPDIGH